MIDIAASIEELRSLDKRFNVVELSVLRVMCVCLALLISGLLKYHSVWSWLQSCTED